MQEEVSKKTVRFAINGTKLTAKLLWKGLVAFKRHHDKKKAIREVKKNTPSGIKTVFYEEGGVSVCIPSRN